MVDTSKIYDEVLRLLNVRKKNILTIAQSSIATEHQYMAARDQILDQLGKEGFETDLRNYLNAGKHLDRNRSGQE